MSTRAGGRTFQRVSVGLLLALVVASGGQGMRRMVGSEGAEATGAITLVSTTQQQGYTIEFYRNTSYPCAISGYQTFAVGYRTEQAPASIAPLLVYMHGGGVGWFDSSGAPQPDAQYKTEESLTTLLSSPAGNVLMPGVMPLVFADPAAFRFLAVSMCSHDFYAGIGLTDPNNPNLDGNGSPITTNGQFATKDAIAFARAGFATSKFFLMGGSAGSIGTYGLAWKLQRDGIAPAGIIADSGVLNQAWVEAVNTQGIPCPIPAHMLTHASEISARLDPEIADPANEPDKLVSSGRLTVPVMQIWTHGDPYGCQSTSMTCPLPDGTTSVLGAMDCMNEPLRLAIAGQGPNSRSTSLSLCVTVANYAPGPCNYHMVTRIAGTNTDPSSPADYSATIMAWIQARLADMTAASVGGIAERPNTSALPMAAESSGRSHVVEQIFGGGIVALVVMLNGWRVRRRCRRSA